MPFAARSGQCRRCISGIRPHITSWVLPLSRAICAVVSSTDGVYAAIPQTAEDVGDFMRLADHQMYIDKEWKKSQHK
jgi:hypothetical protein